MVNVGVRQVKARSWSARLRGFCGAGLLGAVSAFAAAGDLPYDSIANPLSRLPAGTPELQRRGDSLNAIAGRVRVNQAGYRLGDVRRGWARVYYVDSVSGRELTFSVVNDSGRDVSSGNVLVSRGVSTAGRVKARNIYNAATPTPILKPGYDKKGWIGGRETSGLLWEGFLPIDLPRGIYRAAVGKDTSQRFVVSDNIYGMARDAAVKFFGIARSGDHESWFHPPSHLWDGWLVDSTAKNADGSFKYKGALEGGWYDCGNHLKESRTMSYSLAALAMLAATMPDHDTDVYALNQGVVHPTDGIPDVLREAWVGSQFALRSFRLAKGVPDSMYLSVGNPPGGLTPPGKVGVDFLWWGRPENQDAVESVNRGGRHERFPVRNWGSPSMADWAAGLAFLARRYRPYDPVFADTALLMARRLYETAKRVNKPEPPITDYSGESVTVDDMALAAVALLWATRDTAYLADLVSRPGLPDGKGGTCILYPTAANYPTSHFAGGYLGCGAEGLYKTSGTAWANVESFPLYAFAKLVLADPDTALRYGIDKAQRDTLLVRTLNHLVGSELSGSGRTIELPIGLWNRARVTYDSVWFNFAPGSGVSGWYNKYEFGYFADLYMYWDAAGLVEGRDMPGFPAATDWKRDSVERLIVDGMNYMFGLNAMDLSYLMGVGGKNPMHPHHRAANPEGKNVPGADYAYRVPVGALWGGPLYTATEVVDDWERPVQISEANCPDASAAVLIPLMGLSKTVSVQAPVPTVSVVGISDTAATVHLVLDRYGRVRVDFGTSDLTKSVSSGPGVTLDLPLRGLDPSTRYLFQVTTYGVHGDSAVFKAWVDAEGGILPYGFTTLDASRPATYAGIKVCNVTSDSAEVLWTTPDGVHLSSVRYADSASWVAGKFRTVDLDEAGSFPVRFHRVKLRGLKERTTYYFQVGEPGHQASPKGCFRTPLVDVKFDVYASRYNWPEGPDATYRGAAGSVQRALSIGVKNQENRSYDSLMLRLYLRGTKYAPDSMVAFGARCDIGFKYRTDGFIDSGFAGRVDRPLRRSFAQKVDPACPDDEVCDWFFTVPLFDSLGSTVMESQARFRLDLLFDKHKVEYDNATHRVEVYPDLMGTPPRHDPFAPDTRDWSFRPHVAGGDGGLSMVDYAGVPFADKNALDDSSQIMPIAPYMAIYRKNTFVYGFSPDPVEQASKRTVYAMDVVYDKPLDGRRGTVVALHTGTDVLHATGTADIHDALLPAAKGWITSIWVNGRALSAAERSAATRRQADGTWKFDIPVPLGPGSTPVDIAIFGGSDASDTATVDGCQEGNGCAFDAANWIVNNQSSHTRGKLDLFDGRGRALEADSSVVPGEGALVVQVTDGDRDTDTTRRDTVVVRVSFAHGAGASGAMVALVETGPHTGVFRSASLPAVEDDGTTGKGRFLPLAAPDTVVFSYVDPNLSGDSGRIRAFARRGVPEARSGALVGDCDGARIARILLSGAVAGLPDSVQLVRRRPDGSAADTVVLADAKRFRFLDPHRTQLTVDLSAELGGSTEGGDELQVRLASPEGVQGWSKVVLVDSLGPVLDSVARVENLGGGDVDSLFFWTSEPLASGTPWPLEVRRAGNVEAAPVLDPSVLEVTDSVANRYLARLPAGWLQPGDLLRLDPAVARDEAGQTAPDCPPGRPLREMPRPAPFARAWIRDADGDGRADEVVLAYRKALGADDLPDSLDLAFGRSSERRTVPVSASMVTDSVVVVPLETPFGWGITSGTGADGAGGVAVWADGRRSAPAPLSDSVAPVLVSASLAYGRGEGDFDTLRVRWSEALAGFDRTPLVVHRVDGQPADVVGVPRVDADGLGAFLRVRADSAGFARGDVASLPPNPLHSVTDLSGNAASTELWVPIQFGARPFRVEVSIRPFVEIPAGAESPHRGMVAMVRARPERGSADTAWSLLEGERIARDGRSVHVTLTVNRFAGGSAYLYDNAGVFVAALDLAPIAQQLQDGRLPVDGAGAFQMRLAWEGGDLVGRPVASGVYWLRLVLRDGGGAEPVRIWNRIWSLGIHRRLP